MTEFTKQKRQEIVEEFSRRHNGVYNPAVFLDEVKSIGEDHPAYNWFEWDGDKAANEYNLWQARAFVKDLRIKFEVQEVGRQGNMTVTTEMPVVLSPMMGRKDGGGYVLSDPNDPAHMAEHCHQAAAALRSWLKRYQAALIHAGYGVRTVEQVAEGLEGIEPPKTEEAA